MVGLSSFYKMNNRHNKNNKIEYNYAKWFLEEQGEIQSHY